MLHSLLPPEFFKLPKYTVSKPITVTAAFNQVSSPLRCSQSCVIDLAAPFCTSHLFFFFFLSPCVLSSLSLWLSNAFMQLVFPSVFQIYVTLSSMPLHVLLLPLH